jgi:hypothetical protein
LEIYICRLIEVLIPVFEREAENSQDKPEDNQPSKQESSQKTPFFIVTEVKTSNLT